MQTASTVAFVSLIRLPKRRAARNATAIHALLAVTASCLTARLNVSRRVELARCRRRAQPMQAAPSPNTAPAARADRTSARSQPIIAAATRAGSAMKAVRWAPLPVCARSGAWMAPVRTSAQAISGAQPASTVAAVCARPISASKASRSVAEATIASAHPMVQVPRLLRRASSVAAAVYASSSAQATAVAQ